MHTRQTESRRKRPQRLWGALLCGLWACGGAGAGPGDPQQPGEQPALGGSYSGEGTYYGATGAGACSYDPSPQSLLVAAMNAPQWQGSAVCGMCVEVTGPKGPQNTVVVRIVDLCPECKSGDLDLSQEAFAHIAEVAAGRVPITWRPVACAVTGPLSYRFKEGSSQWWMGIQVRNSRLPIQKLALQDGANVTPMKAETYGYFTLSSPSGRPGPYTLQVTALGGQVVTEPGVVLRDAQVVQGTQQF